MNDNKLRVRVKADNSSLYKIQVPGLPDKPFFILAMNDIVKHEGYREALRDALSYHTSVQNQIISVDGKPDLSLSAATIYINRLLTLAEGIGNENS